MKLYSSGATFVEKELQIKPFWKLKAVLNNVALELRPTLEDKFTLRHVDRPQNITIEYDHEREVATVNFSSEERSNLALAIPYRVDLDIILEGTGSAKIADIENEAIQVKGDCYDLELNNLKSHSTNIVTNVGNIKCGKTLRGNLKLRSNVGSISTQKLQGHWISLTAENGLLNAGDIYAQQLTSVSDRIRIKSIHGGCNIQANGDIVIGTAEGEISLLSRKGNIHAHLADHARMTGIVAKAGDVCLTFSQGLDGEFDAEAQIVDDEAAESVLSHVSRQMSGNSCQYKATVNEGTSQISIKSPEGRIALETRSWPEAVTLYNKKSKEQ